MSYTNFISAGNYLEGVFSAQFDTPLTLVAWVKRSSSEWGAASSSQYVCSIAQGSADWNPSLSLRSLLDNGYAWARSTTGSISKTAAENISAYKAAEVSDKWVPIIGVFNTDTDRDVYVINSSRIATNTEECIVTGVLDNVRLGGMPQQNEMGGGYLAEVAIFNTAWTSAEVDQVQTSAETGPTPKSIDPSNCIGYWPLDASAATHPNQGSENMTLIMTVNGNATYNADHPTITGSVTITSVDGDNAWIDGATGLIATGTGFT